MAKAVAKPPLKQPAPKKPAKKPVKQKKPQITGAMFEEWFFKQSREDFLNLQKKWNERNLKIKLPNHHDYDTWLNYFKGLPPNVIRVLATTGLDILTTEGYAALSRWHDIVSHPHRIDKIHQAGLTSTKQGEKKTITELASSNDVVGVLKAARDTLAMKLEKGAGARDTAALVREMSDIMTQIESFERRQAPKKETMLGQLTEGMPNLKKRNKTSGARNVSFASRVTIDDLEETNE